MTITTLETSGFFSAMRALRLPYNKEMYSIEKYIRERRILDIRDIELAQRLIVTGDSHAKPIRGIMAYADITAPLYFWTELETHRCGHERLFSASTQNTEGRRLKGLALQKAKGEIRFDRPMRKVDMFSYQCLRNIVRQRYNHRLPEWHQFIEWIRTLPQADNLILIGLEKEMSVHEEMWKDYKNEIENEHTD